MGRLLVTPSGLTANRNYCTHKFVVFVFGALAPDSAAGDKDKKFEIPKDAIAGKVKSVDMKKPS